MHMYMYMCIYVCQTCVTFDETRVLRQIFMRLLLRFSLLSE